MADATTLFAYERFAPRTACCAATQVAATRALAKAAINHFALAIALGL
jgi:hypothetical protein